MSRNKWKTLYRAKAYVNLGHGSWLGFLLSIGTFTMVFYDYGVRYIPIFKEWFGESPLLFLLVAFPSYVILAGFIGFWAYKSEGPEPTSAALAWTRNPAYQRLNDKLDRLCETLGVDIDGNIEDA